MNKPHLYRKICTNALALLFILSLYTVAAPAHIFARPASANDEMAVQDKEFEKQFREGRDLIDRQDWQNAAEKFSQAVKNYPANKSADAALYWLAFCYRKLGNYEKMGATVDRLNRDFPQSSWTSDAQVLLVEVAPAMSGLTATVAGRKSGAGFSVYAPAQTTGRILMPGAANFPALTQTVIGGTVGEAKIPLEREDEIRLAAFQSLLAADRQKGIAALGEILKADSKSGEPLKIAVLRAVRRPQVFNVFTSLNNSSIGAIETSSDKNPSRAQSNALLRDLLTKKFSGNPSMKIRREIILTLANISDEPSISALATLYRTENDTEVKKAIISGIGASWGDSGFFRTLNSTQIYGTARAGAGSSAIASGNPATVTTTDIFVQPNATDKNAVPNAIQKLRLNELTQIVRTEKNSDLRRLALINLQRFGSLAGSAMIETLTQIYDAETDEDFKKSIIKTFADANQASATRKLLEIAKNDKSDALKLEAIRALGQSRDPEALKYLEEILK